MLASRLPQIPHPRTLGLASLKAFRGSPARSTQNGAPIPLTKCRTLHEHSSGRPPLAFVFDIVRAIVDLISMIRLELNFC